jgi:Fe-S-cluster containining protein
MTPAPFYRRISRVELLPQEPAIDEMDRQLGSGLDATFAEAQRLAGRWLVCRGGCSKCCTGPFPITALDAWRLRRGLDALAQRDPARAAAIVVRARAQVRLVAADFPGDPATGLLDEGAAEEEFATRHAELPCPVLHSGLGVCELYDARPVRCRTYGPPVTIAGHSLPPCRLCFDGAPSDVIEACRVAPDAEGLEDRLLDQLEDAGLTRRQTIVAFAIAEGEQTAPARDDPPVRR